MLVRKIISIFVRNFFNKKFINEILHFCREIGNKWALEQAKRNLDKHYLLVGVTEELENFIQVLEAILPRFFKGAYDLFIHSKHLLLNLNQNNIFSKLKFLKYKPCIFR